jgi:predicted nucleic acid-binding protein
VVLKWFHSEGESEVAPARTILAAHRDGELSAWILDLTLYEVGNVLLRPLGWSAGDVGGLLQDLRELCAPLAATQDELALAAELGERHGLTFYDGAYAAVARCREATLVTADRQLVAAGLGEGAADFVARIGLHGTI